MICERLQIVCVVLAALCSEVSLCAFFTMVRFSFLQVVGSNRAASSLTTPYSLVQFPLDENEKRVSHSPLENESKVST